PSDPNTVYWGLGFIGATAVLYKSTDGGKTAVNIAGNLPGTPINAIMLDASNPGAVYVATDAGVFSAGDGGAQGSNEAWARLGDNLPATGVLSLALTSASGTPTLIAGTHGRGAWSMPALTPLSFSMSFAPTTQTVEAGQPAVFQIQTAASGGASTITFDCSAVPTCTVAPASVPGGGSATLTVTPPDAVTIGSSFTVVASNGSSQQTRTLGLNVFNFEWALGPGATPAPMIESGQQITMGLTVDLDTAPSGQSAVPSPYDAPITFSCPNLAAFLTCSFSPTSIASLSSNTSVTLTLQAAANAPAGLTPLDLRASGGSLARDINMNVGTAPFTLSADPFGTADTGTPASIRVSAASQSGFSGAITLSCSGPGQPQLACSFSPPTITPGQTSVASVTGFAGVSRIPPGGNASDPVVFEGSAGGAIAQVASAVLPNDFVFYGPQSVPTLQGANSTTISVSVAPIGIPKQSVALSCSSPAGLSCSFSPTSLSNSTTFAIATVSGMQSLARSNAIPLTITMTGPTIQHSVAAVLDNTGDIALEP